MRFVICFRLSLGIRPDPMRSGSRGSCFRAGPRSRRCRTLAVPRWRTSPSARRRCGCRARSFGNGPGRTRIRIKSKSSRRNPTKQFVISARQRASIANSEQHKIRRSLDFWPLYCEMFGKVLFKDIKHVSVFGRNSGVSPGPNFMVDLSLNF